MNEQLTTALPAAAGVWDTSAPDDDARESVTASLSPMESPTTRLPAERSIEPGLAAVAEPRSPLTTSRGHVTQAGESRQWVVAGDCREQMGALASCSVSLILTDPPYFIDAMDDGWDHQALSRRANKAGVVSSLPVGMKFDRCQGERLQTFLEPIAKQWMRIIRPGGFVLCFSQNRLVHRAALAIEIAGFEIRDVLLWRYEGQAKAFSQDHFIQRRDIPESEKRRLIAEIGGRKTPQLKPQGEMIILAQAPRDGTFVDNWDRWKTGLIDVSDPFLESDRFPGTVIRASKPRRRYGHMTVKPVDLLRHLVRIFSATESLVFDPFAGSGSTGVAARREGRDFLGIELDREMAACANRRVQELEE